MKRWLVKQEIVKLLQNQTLEMLAAGVASEEYQLTDITAAVLSGLKASEDGKAAASM